MGLDHVFHNAEGDRAVLTAVLDVYQLDAVIFAERRLAALDPLQDRNHRNTIEDGHLTFAAEFIRKILAGLVAGIVVLRSDERGHHSHWVFGTRPHPPT